MREGTIKPRHQDLSGSAMKLLFALLHSPSILLEISLCQQALFMRRKPFTHRLHNQVRDLVLRRKKDKSLHYNNSFLGEYECSLHALDREERKDEKEEIGSLETRSNNVSDQEI
ncbi:hypothetical protein Tco_1090740 [Tanacetum coccineum]|uniref:Uncharacterized protein n=1 Tax=Tanacetum coccineum TaxID=301880 RepID=A0ABQ5I547_9ASTR